MYFCSGNEKKKKWYTINESSIEIKFDRANGCDGLIHAHNIESGKKLMKWELRRCIIAASTVCYLSHQQRQQKDEFKVQPISFHLPSAEPTSFCSALQLQLLNEIKFHLLRQFFFVHFLCCCCLMAMVMVRCFASIVFLLLSSARVYAYARLWVYASFGVWYLPFMHSHFGIHFAFHR